MSKIFAKERSAGIPHDDNNNSRERVIDWLIFNAGIAEVTSLNWFIIAEQLVVDPILLFTVPRYLTERVGSMTDDGIGLVFQANVFGHYYMV
jgi:3-keto steroid reductase